jgi:competence protein ComEC
MGGRCAVPVAVALWLGLLAGPASAAWAWAPALLLALPLAAIASRAPPRTATACALAVVALCAVARGGAHRARVEAARAPVARAGPDALHRIEARVIEPPARESGEPVATLCVLAATPPLVRGSRLRMRLPEGSDAEHGDRVELLARLDLPEPARNPGGWDARAAADARASVAAGKALVARTREGTGVHTIARATTARWRRGLEGAFAARLTPGARALVTPLVTGDRSAIPIALDAALRASGLVHLLALSGLHVVWAATLAGGLAAALGLGVRSRALASAACALAYLAVAGPLPSLARAVATTLLESAARASERALDPAQALGLSAVVLLAIAPGWANDLGFQLSCAASLGLVTVAPALSRSAGGLATVLSPLTATVGAQMTTLPLLLARFHALSWTGFAANLIAVPLAGLLLPAALVAAVADAALPGASRWLWGACEVLAAALERVAEVAAHAPLALVPLGADPLPVACVALGAVALALAMPAPRAIDERLLPRSPAVRVARVVGAVALASGVLAAACAPPLAPPRGRWWMVALDVGQGDAIALGFPHGWWLVDAGARSSRYDAGERVVLPFLRWAGVRRLEVLALTHDDGDHTGGAHAVRVALPVGRWLAPAPVPGTPGPAARFGAETVARGDALARDPLVIARWPPAGEPLAGGDNAASLVLEVGEGPARALLLADADRAVEESLVVATDLAVLKVAHHGSRTSSGEAFVRGIRPRHAVISCGRRNAFGHPDPGVVARLARAGAAIHRTDRDGAVWLELGPDGVRTLDWRRGMGTRSGSRAPAIRPGGSATRARE